MQTCENIPVTTCNITARIKMAAISETLPSATCVLWYSHKSLQDVVCETGGRGNLSACASEFMTGDCYLQSQDGPPADVMHCSVCVCVCNHQVLSFFHLSCSLLSIVMGRLPRSEVMSRFNASLLHWRTLTGAQQEEQQAPQLPKWLLLWLLMMLTT